MDDGIGNLYGNKVRVRVCGICWQNNDLLLVNHRGLTAGDFWAPPGGGLEFGESVEQCLRKEFMEETGLEITIGRFQFACEFVHKPLHAIELFFEVAGDGGQLTKGDDPEMPIIDDVRFMAPDEITKISPSNLHGIFSLLQMPEDLKTLTGFFRI